MNVSDIIIIYLACGSPFGVYQITKRKRSSSGVDWHHVAVAFIFWPVAAAALLVTKIFPGDATHNVEFQNRLEDLRLDFEQTAFLGESVSSLFEFRETFERFAGLSVAATDVRIGKSSAEIFEISGHNNKSLATRCLARRNISRLAVHRCSAREDFVKLIFRITATASNRIELISLASELADHLNDEIAADAFQELTSAPQTRDGKWISGLEKEVWKSQTPSTSTIN